MWVAAFELHSTYTDAFSMLGFPYGGANDAAGLVSWSDRHGFEGVKTLLEGLARLERRPFSSPRVLNESARAVELDAEGGSVLEVGVMALDIALANKCAQVTLRNVEDAVLCMGLGQVAMERGVSVNMVWRQHGQRSLLDVCATKRTLALTWLPEDKQGDDRRIVISQEYNWREAHEIRNDPDAVTLSSGVLAERAHKALLDGIEVDEVAWREVVRVARTILVPESTASRITGAGVGADKD